MLVCYLPHAIATYNVASVKPTIWGCLPKFSYVSHRLHEQWAEPPQKYENNRPLGCGVILTTVIEGQQFCMSKILSYMQFYNVTKAKQTLFAYLLTCTSRHAFACSSTTPTWTRRDVFLYQPRCFLVPAVVRHSVNGLFKL